MARENTTDMEEMERGRTLRDYLEEIFGEDKKVEEKRRILKYITTLSLDVDVVHDLDRARGNTPRSRFVNEILRKWLRQEDPAYR